MSASDIPGAAVAARPPPTAGAPGRVALPGLAPAAGGPRPPTPLLWSSGCSTRLGPGWCLCLPASSSLWDSWEHQAAVPPPASSSAAALDQVTHFWQEHGVTWGQCITPGDTPLSPGYSVIVCCLSLVQACWGTGLETRQGSCFCVNSCLLASAPEAGPPTGALGALTGTSCLHFSDGR